MKEKKRDKSPSAFGRLMEYADCFKSLTYLSLILSAMSSVLALLPFICIWRIIREVLEVQPDFSKATGIVHNGWMASPPRKPAGARVAPQRCPILRLLAAEVYHPEGQISRF